MAVRHLHNRVFGTFRTASEAKPEGIMNTGSSISLNSRAWRDLYRAALFEVDKTKAPQTALRKQRKHLW